MLKRTKIATLSLAVLLLVAGCSHKSNGTAEHLQGTATVLDAETIAVDGKTVRLFAITAPAHSAARGYSLYMLESLAEGKQVACTERWTEKDGVFVGDCSIRSFDQSSGTGLNNLMIRSGAASLRISDFRRGLDHIWADLRTEEFVAQRECIGLWKAATLTPFTKVDVYDLAEPGC